MSYIAKNYENLLGIEGFSNSLLKNHFTLYEGYVKATNNLIEKLSNQPTGTQKIAPEYAELKRRFAWEFNGMRLHELYFENMSKKKTAIPHSAELFEKMKTQFGSYKEWEISFKNTGSMRGIGWTIFCYDAHGDRLINVWIDEHDVGHLAGATPLLVMDVFEHAFVFDYGLKRADYINAFFKVINWDEIQTRYDTAISSRKVIVPSDR